MFTYYINYNKRICLKAQKLFIMMKARGRYVIMLIFVSEVIY